LGAVSLFLPLEAENHPPMTTQLSEICDVGQLIYTMHPTAAYDLAQIDLNNDQIEVYLSMLLEKNDT
jgi:hypothetical protein